MSAVALPHASAAPAESDASVRLPVMLFFGFAVFWLVVGSFLAFVASWKLIHPAFLDGISWLTYGRLQQAGENALVYGWASSAGIGAGIWFLARLGRTALGCSRLLVTAAIFWNVGVLLGLGGIAAGLSTSLPGLEFPGFAAVVLLGSFVCVGIWSLILLRQRTSSGLYASQWYLLAAFLWFPWIYATANLLLVWFPVQGSAQAPIVWWFSNNLVWLWLAPLALASAYFVIPQTQGRTIRSYAWSGLAFWGVAFLGGWSGTRNLIGGPVPAWIVSAGVAASILLIIPIAVVGINTFGTVRRPVKGPALAFTVFGLACMAAAVAQNALTPLFSRVTQFSDYVTAQGTLVLLGFLTMALFGALYFIVPRLMREEFCPIGTSWHFWLVACGLALSVSSLLIGGLIQGFALSDPGVTFLTSLELAQPFRLTAAIGSFVFFLGCVTFAVAALKILLKKADVLPPVKNKGATV